MIILGMRNKTKVFIFLFLFIVGCIFAGWGMMMPPQGVIDGSVLIFVGQVFVLAAAVYGWEIHMDIKEGIFHAGHKQEGTETEGENAGI